ncbi:MAG TPA: glycosyltransferase family 2 protein [Candidatus Nanoarchaeia archaeon]|nr:glycosyltransferase family 2 protein [Candidatus Nanoarchaeia archaeon]
MKVSCIIPAYNEQSTIVRVIAVVKKVKAINEIIVVDDGSTDQTYEYANTQGVKVFKHPKNRGKGAAIKTGMTHCKGDFILFIDADITNLDGNKIINMIIPLKSRKADVVIGTYKFNRTGAKSFQTLVW